MGRSYNKNGQLHRLVDDREIPVRRNRNPPAACSVKFHRRYIVYGLVVDSEIALGTVPEATETGRPADVRMTLGTEQFFRDRTRGLAPPREDWIHYAVLPDGSVYIKVNDILQTVVSADGKSASCAWVEGADRTAFEANFLNFVLSTALTLQGEEPFHSTVLDFEGHVIGLLGPSGAGKSTLAACLIGQGADLVTDDMLRLQLKGGVALVHPGPYRLKLHRDSGQRFLPQALEDGYFNSVTGKLLVRPRPVAPAYDAPRKLSALFWLDEPAMASADQDISLNRLGGLALARTLIASAMNVRYHVPERLERRLRFAEQVARTVPVYALEYPRRFAIMQQVVREIRRAVSA